MSSKKKVIRSFESLDSYRLLLAGSTKRILKMPQTIQEPLHVTIDNPPTDADVMELLGLLIEALNECTGERLPDPQLHRDMIDLTFDGFISNDYKTISKNLTRSRAVIYDAFTDWKNLEGRDATLGEFTANCHQDAVDAYFDIIRKLV